MDTVGITVSDELAAAIWEHRDAESGHLPINLDNQSVGPFLVHEATRDAYLERGYGLVNLDHLHRYEGPDEINFWELVQVRETSEDTDYPADPGA